MVTAQMPWVLFHGKAREARNRQKEWGQVLNGAPPRFFSDSCAIQDLTPFFLRIRASQQRRHGSKDGAGELKP